ncbi:hypothetical protein H2200_000689 [Cladophialophora chaetospira]|uniref:ATP-grasp domain-containing protein n=1 Tax=Cladophialophora chaetospira TaxID=386627 RepID=A0AA38XP06_9EURO|nr:hypothetical protein H2200_000689 [Cladophialophora chaetospira]
MLDANSSRRAHTLQNAALILLSIAFLPLNTFILVVSFLVAKIIPNNVERSRDHARQEHGFEPRTILVTGVGMTKGLVLARLFYEAGHNVIGADFEPDCSLVCGRVSRSLRRFYRLQKPDTRSGASPYIQSLLEIVSKEKVNLWVSCSGVASAVEDGMAKEVVEARTSCKAVQFDVKTTQLLHEKHSFIKHTKSIGLTVPETHEITSRATVERILCMTRPGRKYIMKTIGVDDSVRADMTLLPKASQIETSKHIARLKISEESPWILQEFVRGSEYCTHSLVVKGQVKAFVACPSAELLMHYKALPFDASLSQAMLNFTKKYASSSGPAFTGHLSFDFMVEKEDALDPNNITLYPIECNPRAHTAVALFNNTTTMVDGYLSALDVSNGTSETPIARPLKNDKYYWVGHDLVNLIVLPTISFLKLELSYSILLQNYVDFIGLLLTWKDGTYEIWDPLPWWWLYHIYWPMRFLSCVINGKKWSRLNVSTTKMFDC